MPQLLLSFLALVSGTILVPTESLQLPLSGTLSKILSPQSLLNEINNLLILSPNDLAKIDQVLLNIFQVTSLKPDIHVEFGGTDEVLNSFHTSAFPSVLESRKELISRLETLALLKQSLASNLLSVLGVPFKSFWITNIIVIKNAALGVVTALSTVTDVTRIRLAPVVALSPIVSSNVREFNAQNSVLATQWGIEKIQADQCWSQFGTKGEDVVVATIDSGVRGTHSALAGNMRPDYNWFDPISGSSFPNDGNGHGTHTMGTIAGQGGIGVAPRSKWIACMGCDADGSCSTGALLSCGQWMANPTKPDGSDPNPGMAPDLVSCSWGSLLGEDTWYNGVFQTWERAGILHCFAIGNSGPACKSGGSPGDQKETLGVGSTDINDKLSSFSSKGPVGTTTTTPYIKPDITAPGSNIFSAWNTGDNDFNTISGTSMATPHVAGVMALMLSIKRTSSGDPKAKMRLADVEKIIEGTADTQTLSTGMVGCDVVGGTTTSPSCYPNSQFGFGRVNALKAVNATQNGLPLQPNPNAACGGSSNKKTALVSTLTDLFALLSLIK